VQSNPDGPREPDDTPGDPSEAAWQAIVENYGDRAEIDEPPAPEPPAPTASTAPFGGRFGDLGGIPHEDDDVRSVDDDTFEPPPPPPLPRLAPDRLAAWAGVFGSPTVLFVAVILGIGVPSLLMYLLVASFVGGFLYLVYRMPRGPRDPWDDGAQV
jgi:hypothetical protein